jgi:cytochrome c
MQFSLPTLFILGFCLSVSLTGTAVADLRGHGGPVRALAVSPDGSTLLTGSFDTTAILWNGQTEVAAEVLRGHEDSVNAAVFSADGAAITAGQDGRVLSWPADGEGGPRELHRHNGPVVALALSPDGNRAASASWDGTVRVFDLVAGGYRELSGHQANVNAVGFLADGRVVSAGYDLTVRVWPADGDGASQIFTLAAPLNALVVTAEGAIIAAGADGIVRILDADGEPSGDIETAPVPVTALALSRDDTLLAAALIDGSVWLIDPASREVVRTIQGADSPVWSLAFDRNGMLLTGGGDRVVRRWNPATGQQLDESEETASAEAAVMDGSRGAEVFRACEACHTLTQDGGNRAGPTLHGIFGRPIASVEGYDYSPAFRELDIVWTPETVSELFDVGPNHYTPGTKMPEQRIASAEDRKALMEFLERTTR